MIYLVLNVVFAVFLFYLTAFVDRARIRKVYYTNQLTVGILTVAIMAALFAVLISTVFPRGFFQLIARSMFFCEAYFLVNISFYFITQKVKTGLPVINAFMVAFYAVAFYIVFTKFQSIEISIENGIIIQSPFVFPVNMRDFFPWSWVSLYVVLFRFALPGFCCIIMLLLNEYKMSPLERIRSVFFVLALVAMWGTLLFISVISRAVPCFSLVYLLAYIFCILVLLKAETITYVPSKNDIVIVILTIVFTYIVPMIFITLVFIALFVYLESQPLLFVVLLATTVAGTLIFASRITAFFTSTFSLRSVGYEKAFEQDLASIDYSGEMDGVINAMYNVFARNVECRSMSIFINSGLEVFTIAFSSNNIHADIPVSNAAFDELLNIGKTVVAYNKISEYHGLENVREEFANIFKLTDSDALILLNEGRNILGFITLGAKTNGEHYSSYDVTVFTNLYSYFFVFGYYMRNISNRDVIGTVNSEIRMSSQIIASIQQDTDAVINQKLDAGYIMIPAHNIGGELVDLIRINNNMHLFVTGSLSGRGIAASMSMVIFKSILRTFLSETHDFKALVSKVNLFVRENLPKGSIFSGVFALMDFCTDTMYYINCGIPAIFLYTQAYNNVIEIQGRGHVLGFVHGIDPYISVRQIKLNSGDVVLACTHGLINSRSLRGEEFGKDRVQQVLMANITYSASRIAQFEYDGLVKFMSKNMEDDVSILVMKYAGKESVVR